MVMTIAMIPRVTATQALLTLRGVISGGSVAR
jgi:hypothetical protein